MAPGALAAALAALFRRTGSLAAQLWGFIAQMVWSTTTTTTTTNPAAAARAAAAADPEAGLPAAVGLRLARAGLRELWSILDPTAPCPPPRVGFVSALVALSRPGPVVTSPAIEAFLVPGPDTPPPSPVFAGRFRPVLFRVRGPAARHQSGTRAPPSTPLERPAVGHDLGLASITAEHFR
ncbi:hypothetical protein B0T20DRAFT_475984 [Sordaria brevicollis]|uniref:Uncharacterized protein n=1 Tax=Sordaria brevicollis TaxID=83679 RepID=A0AAE0UF22_SORBR|nr:hypothetical protein B0T20DRAFT_475984 [Sordaria brevicollis]